MGKSSKKVAAVGGGAKPTTSTRATSGGCMSAVFHFFDLQFCLHHPPPSSFRLPLPSHSPLLKGTEAPRNSLELESEVSVLSSSKQYEKLHIPMGMQIKTSCDQRRSTSVDLSSSSPGVKTPTLVARLMGLDLLPDSPSSISATPTNMSHLHRLRSRPGTRSLPETPRVSSSSSRLSLQINLTEALEKRNEMKWQDENRSPSEYARQSVSKRVGLADVTNTYVSRNQEHRRDQELLIKSKKSSKPDHQLRFFESKNKPASTTHLPTKRKQGKKVSSGTGLINKPPQTSDIMRKNKQEEPFVRSSSTAIKRPTGNIIPHYNKTPLPSQAKKDHSSPVTKIVLVQTQVSGDARESRGRSQLSSCLSHDEYDQVHTARATGDEYEYVTRILNHKDKSLSFTTWFSPSHPLHPSLFHQLEHPPHTTTVAHRKLLFHLVDELLAQILRPHLNTVAQHFGGSELVDTLCTKIRSFPAKHCTVLEDIDEIIEGDLGEWKIRGVGRLGLEEEGERIVSEIEEEVVDSFLHEMVASWGRFGTEGCWRRNGGVWE